MGILAAPGATLTPWRHAGCLRHMELWVRNAWRAVVAWQEANRLVRLVSTPRKLPSQPAPAMPRRLLCGRCLRAA